MCCAYEVVLICLLAIKMRFCLGPIASDLSSRTYRWSSSDRCSSRTITKEFGGPQMPEMFPSTMHCHGHLESLEGWALTGMLATECLGSKSRVPARIGWCSEGPIGAALEFLVPAQSCATHLCTPPNIVAWHRRNWLGQWMGTVARTVVRAVACVSGGVRC